MTADFQRGKIYRDPFAVELLPKAFYHPSPEKKLSKDKRKITISPERRILKAPEKEKQGSPADEKFLQGTHHYQTKPGTEEDTSSSKFDESWPSSERQSSISINDGEDINPVGNGFQLASDRLADLQQHVGEKVPISSTASVKISAVDSQERKKSAEESVIQKYVERFRKGTPMSREERQKQNTEEEKDFWWLSQGKPPTPASSSTPKDDETSKRTRSFLSTFQDTKSRPFEVPPSPGEEKTRHLQEKADRLLEKSSSTLTSSGPIVSTVGLGSDLSSFEEPAYRPGFAREADSSIEHREWKWWQTSKELHMDTEYPTNCCNERDITRSICQRKATEISETPSRMFINALRLKELQASKLDFEMKGVDLWFFSSLDQ